MKIAHLTSAHAALDPRIFYKEAVTLGAAGHDVVVVAAADAQNTTVQGVRIHAVAGGSSRVGRMTATVIRVVRAALAERAEVYHFHDPELIVAGILLKMMGKRVIYDVHDDLPGLVLSRTWIRPWLRVPVAGAARAVENTAARVFDGIIVANPPHRQRFPKRKTEVVSNLPILEEFPNDTPIPYRARTPAIAYVGDLTLTRGAKEMVRAIALVPDELGAKLWLAGRFNEPGLEAACRALPGWSRVEFRGWHSRREVAALLRQVRVGLVLLHPVPHYKANYSVKLFEYMAAGLPVVASEFSLGRGVIEETGCGLVVDPLDPAAIAEAVRWLLDNPGEAEAMGRRGRHAVEERYNWSIEGQKLVRYYERFRGRDNRTPTAAPTQANQGP